MIEFEKMPPSLDDFASLLDKTLQQLNSDYEAKRYKEISSNRWKSELPVKGPSTNGSAGKEN